MVGDLAILSAEKYDDGGSFGPARRSAARKASRQSSSGGEDGSASKKRSRASNTESGEADDDEKKRARGRPRLDTKDETAQDRRRTQIRLAQRAYRNRKENAIQTLEKTVQGLKDTNDEMTSAFMKLHDYVMSQGLPERDPELGDQLRRTTARFYALARKSSEGSEKGDETSDGQNDRESSQVRSGGGESSSPDVVSRTDSTSGQASRPVALYGGFVITHEPVAESEPLGAALSSRFSHGMPATSPALDYEWVTQPTLDNASFPIVPVFDPLFPYMPGLDPMPNISTPRSFSQHEATFGRRLQRMAIEHALKLISASNPEPQRFARVFGFCMLFEPLDSIRRRLRVAVDRTKQEALNYWQYPFVHLGGAGTHYDGNDGSMIDGSRPMGNQGSIDIMRPQHHTGFSTGPFDPATAEARDNMMDQKLRMVVPGFQGDFYDCDEVEFYLHNRGVNIPPTAEFVSVEVDMTAFDDTDPPSNLFGPSGSDSAAMAGLHGLDVANSFLLASEAGGAGGVMSAVANDSAMGSSVGAPNSAAPSVSLSPVPSQGDSAAARLPGQDVSDSALAPWSLGGGLPAANNTNANNPFLAAPPPPAGDFPGSVDNLLAFAGMTDRGNASAGGLGRKKGLLLDVNVLVHELVERATCLGRTPGFRPKDVNAAFWIATRNSA